MRVLKLLRHLLAFSGSRTYHRNGSCNRRCCFDIRDQIMCCMVVGFTKSLNLGKSVDKKLVIKEQRQDR